MKISPCTFLLKATKLVPEVAMTKQKAVGIRIPDNKICLRLVKELGNPMGRRTFYGVGLVLWILLLGLSGVCIAEDRYAVKSGDSLSKISKNFGVTVDMLKEANGLKGNALKPKQILIIPTQREEQAGESRRASAKNPGEDSGTSKRSLERKDSYIVQKVDTLQTFPTRAGSSVEELKTLNHLNTLSLEVGQTLMLSELKLSAPDNEEEVGDAEEAMDEQVAEKNEERQKGSESPAIWSNPEERSLLVRLVKTFLGIPYRFGGSTLKGLDCSAFVRKIYEVFNIHLPRTTREQLSIGKRVTKEELEEGDLVFFKTRAPRANNAHVGIYIGKNEFVHASSRNREVKVDNLNAPYFSSHFLRGVRVKELARDLEL